MAHNNTLFNNMLKIIPRHEFSTLEKRHGTGRKARSFMLAWSYASIKDYKHCLKQLSILMGKAIKSDDDKRIIQLANNIATVYFCSKDYKNAEKFYGYTG